MTRKDTQLSLRSERKEFKDRLKIHCRINRIPQRNISEHLGVTDQEFHNMLTGFQSSVPGKGVEGYEEFCKGVSEFLGVGV